jgi:hypothetical protein
MKLVQITLKLPFTIYLLILYTHLRQGLPRHLFPSAKFKSQYLINYNLRQGDEWKEISLAPRNPNPGNSLTLRPFYPPPQGKTPPYLLYRRLSGPQGQSALW